MLEAETRRLDAAIAKAPSSRYFDTGYLAPSTALDRAAVNEPLRAVDAHELAAMRFKSREPILTPWLNSQDLTMVYAPRGIGKTHFCLAAMFAVATGGTFAKWHAPVPKRVLYLDGELPGALMQRRLLTHCPDVEPQPGFFRVFTPDLLPDGRALPDLSTLEGQDAIDEILGDAEVVCVDNLSAWARTGRENEAESWIPVADWILRLRRRGLAVVLVHHAGKSGQQRGTSKREDLLDSVISLSRPKDYDPKQGAVFVAEFTKARNLTGGDAESLEFRLGGDENRATWTWCTAEGSTYERIVQLTQEGLKPAEICAELEINKSTVSRHLRKAREIGDLSEEARP